MTAKDNISAINTSESVISGDKSHKLSSRQEHCNSIVSLVNLSTTKQLLHLPFHLDFPRDLVHFALDISALGHNYFVTSLKCEKKNAIFPTLF